MSIPIHHLKKEELVWLATHYCKKHHHNFLSHYSCLSVDNPDKTKIGFLDIETSGLKANYSYMISYCILDDKTDKIFSGVINKKDLSGTIDKRIVGDCIDDMKRFDKIVGFNSTNFDLPFLRTRALYWGLDFPGYGELTHRDAYYMGKSKLCMTSKGQASVSSLIVGKTEKTHINPFEWAKASLGNKKFLKIVLDHNERDVRDLKKVYYGLLKFVRRDERSI